MAPGVLECDGPHSYPAVLCWDDSPSAGPASPERRACDLLCQHHLLVHPAAGHLRCQQVPGALRHDDWENGERSCVCALGLVSSANNIAADSPVFFFTH